MSVILINCFEVPPGREDDFLRGWHAIAEHLVKQPGYVATKLHRSLRPDARYPFINVGVWASPQDFQSATTSDEFRELAAALAEFPATPGLYNVEYEHSS
jgi:heme-degrading monooxygenase HmoA